MKAYRRRKADERTGAAEKRRRDEMAAHQEQWTQFLIQNVPTSRRQAERTYVLLMSLRRLDGPPWEQLQMV